MARSLTVHPEENVCTTSLLNGFLLFAAGCMLLSALSWPADTEIEPTAPVEASLGY